MGKGIPRRLSLGSMATGASPSQKTDLSPTSQQLSQLNIQLEEQVASLSAQLKRYQDQAEHFELVKSDWLMEKEALEDVLLKLREQIREQEEQIKKQEEQIKNQETELASGIQKVCR